VFIRQSGLQPASGPLLQFALATATDEPPIGVIVVKAGFQEIDEFLTRQPHPAAITTADGIVLASNNPEWLYRAAFPLIESPRQPIGREPGNSPIIPSRRYPSGWTAECVSSREADTPWSA